MKNLFALALALGFAFGASAQTTFNVDVSCIPSGFDNLFVTGPWCGWCANDVYNTMTDPDGDGVYSVTVEELEGTVEYKYAINGFEEQEDLVNDMVDGADCAPITDFNGYANRTAEAGSTTNDYYGTCDGTCNDVPPTNVKFQVDMAGYEGAFGSVTLNGEFNGWCGNCAPMTDDDGDGVYELTVPLTGDTLEYKFAIGAWEDQEDLEAEASCALTTYDEGAPNGCCFVNRFVVLEGDDMVQDVVCWNSCQECNAAPVLGCTNAEACNYDAVATEDDGSCIFGDGPVAGLELMEGLCAGDSGMVSLDSLSMGLYDSGVNFMVDMGTSMAPMPLTIGGLALAPGSYIFTATDSLGCSSETFFELGSPEVLTIATEIVMFSTGVADGQAEATVTGGTPDYNVVWTNLGGLEVNPDSLGVGLYTVFVTDANGCTAQADLTMTVDGMEEMLDLEASLFPVPVQDELTLRLGAPLRAAAIVTLFDAQGRQRSTEVMSASQSNITLNTSGLAAGLYTIQLTTEEVRASWNFVK
jgi:hypothetical protein